MQHSFYLALAGLTLTLTLAACTSKAPCVVCYEDEWSRTPFPGQATQHIPPLPDPKNN